MHCASWLSDIESLTNSPLCFRRKHCMFLVGSSAVPLLSGTKFYWGWNLPFLLPQNLFNSLLTGRHIYPRVSRGREYFRTPFGWKRLIGCLFWKYCYSGLLGASLKAMMFTSDAFPTADAAQVCAGVISGTSKDVASVCSNCSLGDYLGKEKLGPVPVGWKLGNWFLSKILEFDVLLMGLVNFYSL